MEKKGEKEEKKEVKIVKFYDALHAIVCNIRFWLFEFIILFYFLYNTEVDSHIRYIRDSSKTSSIHVCILAMA